MIYLGAFAIFSALLVAYWVGTRRTPGEGDAQAVGVVGTSLFALLGLILAFSFSAAWGRFDSRRHLSVEEANALGTLALRLDLLPREAGLEAKQTLLAYVRERLAFNQSLERPLVELVRSPDLFSKDRDHRLAADELWKATIIAVRQLRDAPDRALILTALNQALDLADKRRVESRTGIPPPVAVLLILTSVICAYLAGREVAGRPDVPLKVGWAFVVCVAATLLSVFDLQDPRVGLIRIDYTDALFRETEAVLEAAPEGR